MDASPFPQILVDRSGQILKKNASWQAQLPDLALAQFVHPVDFAKLCAAFDGTASNVSLRALRDQFWWLARVRLIPNGNQYQIEWDWLQPDVQRNDANMQTDEMLGGIVHSFNNYLSAMMGFAELAMLDLPATHAIFGQLQTIVDSGQQASQFTRQLLLCAGRAVLQKKRVNWQLYVVETFNLHSLSARGYGEPVELAIDPDLMREVFGSLLHYLNKYQKTALDIDASTLDISAQNASELNIAPGRYAAIRIVQRGKGLAPEHLAKIFQPYYFNSLVNEKKGLGLAPLHGLFTQLKGRIFAFSDADGGWGIYGLLPVHQEVDATSDVDASMMPLWCIADSAELVSIVRSLLPNTLRIMWLTEQDALELLRQGYQPSVLISTALGDVAKFRDLRAALHFPHFVWTPFSSQRPISEAGVVVIRADFAPESLHKALSTVLK